MRRPDLRSLTAPLILVAARARRRRARWLWPLVGLIVAGAFAVTVAVEATIAGDQAARSVLASLGPPARSVAVSWQGPASPAVDRRAATVLDELGLRAQTRVLLLNPVRLSGIVVRVAAISPLGAWVHSGAAARLGPCRTSECPVMLAGARLKRTRLIATGVSLRVLARAALTSAVPLGFTADAAGAQPLLLTGDVPGLGALGGLGGVYRTSSWIGLPALSRLHSWELAAAERRLAHAQATLAQAGTQFSLSAPFDGLDRARAQAAAAPQRLLPAGGGALAALSLFVILTAYGLRRDQRSDIDRLLIAGGRTGQVLVFALAEAAWLSALGLLAGAALGVGIGSLLATGAGLPAGGVLDHSVLTATGGAVLLGGWLVTVVVIGLVLLLPGGAVADVAGVSAVSALALALSQGPDAGGPLPLLLAPLACVAGGALLYRLTAMLLRGGERLARRGPAALRLALVGLARAPVAPALATAFIAVSLGLSGFALSYRATLRRAVADQAADAVPLDAVIAPSASFSNPLQMAGMRRWQALAAGGTVLAVRRTDASLARDGTTVTVPALGVPAAGLKLIHGWRPSDGSASLTVLSRRLRPAGPVRSPGPEIPVGARSLALTVRAPGAEVAVTADLRDAGGAVIQTSLGLATTRTRTVRARLPRGRFELEALELDEPTGLAATNGHQNAENPGAATQASSLVALGALVTRDGAGRPLSIGGRRGRRGWRGWRGVGAAHVRRATESSLRIRFANAGTPGIVRPSQPSDTRPVSVLVDPVTAAGAADHRLALTVDGLPVAARVVGVLNRFPTVPADAGGFVVADEPALAGALDASLPGQGRADELWIATTRSRRLRNALARRPLSSLSASFRVDVERSLAQDPITRAVLDTLGSAAAAMAVLGIAGLLMAMLGAMREPHIERDLDALGLGPRQLRDELRLRILAAGALGVTAGMVLSLVLTRLIVVTVRAAGAVTTPDPPLIPVAAWSQLIVLALGALGAFALAGWIAAAIAVGRRSNR